MTHVRNLLPETAFVLACLLAVVLWYWATQPLPGAKTACPCHPCPCKNKEKCSPMGCLGR